MTDLESCCEMFFFFFFSSPKTNENVSIEPFDLEIFHGRPHFPSICHHLKRYVYVTLENPLTFHSKVSFHIELRRLKFPLTPDCGT